MLRQLLITLLRYRAEGDRLSGALHLRRCCRPGSTPPWRRCPRRLRSAASVRAHLACAGLFLPVARELLGEAHPFVEAACWEHLRRQLPELG